MKKPSNRELKLQDAKGHVAVILDRSAFKHEPSVVVLSAPALTLNLEDLVELHKFLGDAIKRMK